MANTYTQIHLQLVFCVQNRESLIHVNWKQELYRYMTGIIQNSGHKVLQINGMPDHVHILIGMRPTEALSGLMKKVKSDSSEWINSRRFVRGKFRWQEGFGAFSYSKSDLPNVIRYIQNQEQHHAKQTFREEYLDILRKNEVEFDDRYVFQDV